MNIRIILPVLLICAAMKITNAQISYNKADFKDKPVWIKMMDDENVNYFLALEAFDTYWKGRELPNEENEEREMSIMPPNPKDKTAVAKYNREIRERDEEQKREAGKTLNEKDLPEHEWKREMILQCKRFKDWKLSVKPFVQNDGHILTIQERDSMYQQKLNESKQGK